VEADPWLLYRQQKGGKMILDEFSRDHYLRPEIGKPLVAIGYVYILIFIMVSGVHWYKTQGWSHFLDISYNLSDANNWLALLIMLPGIGLVRIGEKLRKLDASDRLVAKLQEMSLSPDSATNPVWADRLDH
jgi:hypothetical protein